MLKKVLISCKHAVSKSVLYFDLWPAPLQMAWCLTAFQMGTKWSTEAWMSTLMTLCTMERQLKGLNFTATSRTERRRPQLRLMLIIVILFFYFFASHEGSHFLSTPQWIKSLCSLSSFIPPPDWQRASASWRTAPGVWTISSTATYTACGRATTTWAGATRASPKVTWRRSLSLTTFETSPPWRWAVLEGGEFAEQLNNEKVEYLKKCWANTYSVLCKGAVLRPCRAGSHFQ